MITEFDQTQLDSHTQIFCLNTKRYHTNTVRFYYQQELQAGHNTQTALAMRLLQHGSLRFPSRLALAKHLETLYGSQLETGVAKVGPYQLAYVQLEVPAERFLPGAEGSFSQALATALEVLAEPAALVEPPCGGILQQEKEYLAQDIRSLVDDKARYSIVRCNQEMFRPAPHSLSELGTLADVAGVAGLALPSHYRHLTTSATMVIFLVGDFSRQQLTSLERITALRHGASGPGDVPAPPLRPQPQEVVQEADVSQARICLGLRATEELQPEDYYPLVIYNGILGGFPHSKLFIELREKAQLAYDVWSFLSPVPVAQYVMAGVHPQEYRRALAIMEEQRGRIQAGHITSTELEDTQKGIINRLRGITDTPERLVGTAMADLLARRRRGQAEQIRAFAQVKAADVVRVAQKIQLDTTLVLVPRRCPD